LKRNAIILHHDLYDDLAMLSPTERGDLIWAVYQYDIFGTVPSFSDRALTCIFNQMKRFLDANHRNYEQTCKARSENAKKRWSKAKKEDEIQNDAFADNTNTNTNTNTNMNTKSNTNTITITNSDTNINTMSETDNNADVCAADEKTGEGAAAAQTFCDETHTKKNGYGEFHNVFLSAEEFGKLSRMLPDVMRSINSMSAYMKATGKTYADHYAQLMNWRLFPYSDGKAAETKKMPGERREPTFDVSEFTKKAVGIKYVPPKED